MEGELQYFELNTGAKVPSIGLGTYATPPQILAPAIKVLSHLSAIALSNVNLTKKFKFSCFFLFIFHSECCVSLYLWLIIELFELLWRLDYQIPFFGKSWYFPNLLVTRCTVIKFFWCYRVTQRMTDEIQSSPTLATYITFTN